MKIFKSEKQKNITYGVFYLLAGIVFGFTFFERYYNPSFSKFRVVMTAILSLNFALKGLYHLYIVYKNNKSNDSSIYKSKNHED
jgi:divalent metal cation (Fe/Co/Zn/Cd) transporter